METKKKLVVLSGAGISAESGLKTFRDSDGLWEGYDVREVATPGAWRKNPQLVLEFYNMRRKNVKDELVYPIFDDISLGQLAADGAQLRPNIVWFEEPVPLIEEAARRVAMADIFVVVGTSLAVYPAAGLIHYASARAKKFIIDKRIPDYSGYPDIVVIERPATQGVGVLVDQLIGKSVDLLTS